MTGPGQALGDRAVAAAPPQRRLLPAQPSSVLSHARLAEVTAACDQLRSLGLPTWLWGCGIIPTRFCSSFQEAGQNPIALHQPSSCPTLPAPSCLSKAKVGLAEKTLCRVLY